jgi:nucleotide-binding universal stress UspA family protein
VIRIKRILVATDFSPAARLAVWRAGRIARDHDAALQLIHVRPDWNLFCQTASASAEHYQAISQHAEEALQSELEYLERIFGIVARGDTRMGRASEVLGAVVAEVEPHLFVIGARGEHDSSAQSPFVGGTALKLMAQTDCPLLLVRKQGSGSYGSLVTAINDMSEISCRLIEWSTVLLKQGDCHVVHAFDVPFVARMRARGIPDAEIHKSTESARRYAMSCVEEAVGQAGVDNRLHAHVVCGEPISTLLGEIARCQPDLVVVGRHRRVPRESAARFVGTIAWRIAYHAPSDVLIVP